MIAKLLILSAAVASLATAQNSVESRAMLNQGVTAFKSANYAEAVQDFQKAVDLDPSFVNARLYLATAYMQQYIPGAESPENRAFADNAIREFNRVLDMDPSNRVAMASIASLYLNQKQWDNAQQTYERLVSTDPNNADAYYSMGFIAWSRWYPSYAAARRQIGMKQEDPGPLPGGAVKADLKAKYSGILEQGLENLQKALAINPQYDDAMAYMNLLIRERADLNDTQADYQRDIATADDWVQKALATKRQKAEMMPATGTGAVPGLGGFGGGSRVPPGRIRIAENVEASLLVTRVAPVTPVGASGQVSLAVVIAKDGTVMDIRVQSGDPALIPAAMNAVRQWVYKPTLLNGQPVEVSTTVTLNFQ